MKEFRVHRVLLAPVVVAVGCACAFGDVVLTNLAEPLRATTDIGNNPNPNPPPFPVTEWSWAAQSFTTDAASYSLTKIEIIAGNAANGPVIVAELHADSGGTIGPLIATLTHGDFAGPPSPRALTPSAALTLGPSTTYWVVLGSQVPGDGTLGWSYADTNSSEGVGTIGAYADSQDSGANWNYGTVFPYFIQVVGEPTVACSSCAGDANHDNVVNFGDITSVLTNFGIPCN